MNRLRGWNRTAVYGIVAMVAVTMLLTQCEDREGNVPDSPKAAGTKPTELSIGIQFQDLPPAATKVTLGDKTIELPEVSPFAIATTEVTQAQFREVLGHGPAKIENDNHPVDQVTLTEARSFCNALTAREHASGELSEDQEYRLPMLTEWLRAASPKGMLPDPATLTGQAWIPENSGEQLHPVGSKNANAAGVHDILGNAAEWVLEDPRGASRLLSMYPARYEAMALIQIDGGNPRPEDERQSFLARQLKAIKDPATLGVVVDEIELATEWKQSREACVEIVADALQVEHQYLSLVRITVAHPDPQWAYRLANTILEVYSGKRRTEEAEAAKVVLQQMQEDLEAQQARVREAQQNLLQLMKNLRATDAGTSASGAESAVPEDELLEYQQARKDYESTKKVLNDLQVARHTAEVNLRLPQEYVVITEPPQLPRRVSIPAAGTQPMLLGGSAFQLPEDLLDPRHSLGRPDERLPGAGFRIVRAPRK